MKPSETVRACFLSLAILPLAGAALDFDFSSSRWIVLAAAAAIILPIVIMVAKQTARSRREYNLPPIESTSDRISSRLVVLSSAAVLAVYSAGYLKTRAAADRLAEREREAKHLVATVVPAEVPTAPVPPSTPSPSTDAPEGPKPNKDDGTSPSARTKRALSPRPSTSEKNSAASSTTVPGARFRDGIYQGRGTSPHGDIVAQVAIRKGQIVFAGIAECLTRYSCSVIKELPAQVVMTQETNFDVVSGASESSDAFRDAVTEALSKAAVGGAKVAQPSNAQPSNPEAPSQQPASPEATN